MVWITPNINHQHQKLLNFIWDFHYPKGMYQFYQMLFTSSISKAMNQFYQMLCTSFIKCYVSVLPKTMSQFYQSGLLAPFRSNFIEITIWHDCSPVNLLLIFRTPFRKNTSGRLLLTFFMLFDINKLIAAGYPL